MNSEIWVTESGHEARVTVTELGQWRAEARRSGYEVWVEIGCHYLTQESARDACEVKAYAYLAGTADGPIVGPPDWMIPA